MKYYINKTLNADFNYVVEKITTLLKEKGFGIITEIDIRDTLKKKLDVDFKKYVILGACNPNFAYNALQQEDLIGVLLPCNVIIIEQEKGKVEVATMNASETMRMTGNTSLQEIADTVNEHLEDIIRRV